MKIALLSLPALLIAAAPPAPQLSLLQSGASDVGAVIDQSVLVVVDDVSAVTSFDGERMHVTQAALDQVHNRQEARALAALAMAYGQGRIKARDPHKPGAAEYVAAFPLYMIAQSRKGGAIDYGDSGVNRADPEEIKSDSRQLAGHRASLAVHLAERAGSCTGPMVDLLNRMRGTDSTSAAATRATPSGFARMVLRDLGKQAYPPDQHCVG